MGVVAYSHVCPHSQIQLSEVGWCGSVLLQCSLVFDLQALMYSSDRAKIAFVVNLLSGAQWATAVIKNRATASANYELFVAEL